MRRSSVLAVAVAVVGSVTLGACQDNKRATATSRTVPSVQVTALPADSARSGGNGDLNPQQVAAITNLVAGYTKQASVEPWARGSTPAGLEAFFTADALAAANGTDREVLTDTGLAKPTRDFTATVAPLSLTALFDPNGQPVYVSTTLDQQLRATTATGPMSIRRSGELVLVPCDGRGCAAGEFRIRSYALITARTLPDGTTTTAKGKR
ncbi:MAG: hypothetical protein ACOYNI_08125 [Acidimicrobiia bacterium]